MSFWQTIKNAVGTVINPATEEKQTAGNASLASVDGKITTCDTGAVAVASSALPTGASTSSNQTSGAQKTQIVDGSGNVISADTNRLKVVAGLLDESGNAYGVKHVNNKPRVSSMPYGYDIVEGNITGHKAWSKIGFTPTMTTAESDIWSAAGVYTFPTAAGSAEVVSSNNVGDKPSAAIFSGTDNGGSTTTLVDTTKNFLGGTAVAVGDCILLDKSGTTPEYGYVTSVAATTLGVSGGFSSGGSALGRTYQIVDKSSSTNAQVVKVCYLTDTFAEKCELVHLNGTTAVALVNTDIYRVNSFRVVAIGSATSGSAGNLTLRVPGPGLTLSYISAGFTRARNIIYTVPTGKTLYVTSATFSFATTGNANKEYARLYTRATQESGFRTPGIFQAYTEVSLQNTVYQVVFLEPTSLKSGVDLKISGIATASGLASAALRGWLETSG